MVANTCTLLQYLAGRLIKPHTHNLSFSINQSMKIYVFLWFASNLPLVKMFLLCIAMIW